MSKKLVEDLLKLANEKILDEPTKQGHMSEDLATIKLREEINTKLKPE
jgi:hypothetical protein